MKRALVGVMLLLISFAGFSQADTSLAGRLQIYLTALDLVDRRTMFEYSHPMMFKYLSREQWIKTAPKKGDKGFEDRFDSLKVEMIYPEFTWRGDRFALIRFFMVSDTKVDLTDYSVNEFREMVRVSKENTGKDMIFDSASSVVHHRTSNYLVAIKDKFSPDWTFLAVNDDEKSRKRFSRQVIAYINSYIPPPKLLTSEFYLRLKSKIDDLIRDTTLLGRLTNFIAANDSLDFEKILDYSYPKLFTNVTREQMLRNMEASFDSEELSIHMDSLKIEKIYPVFSMDSGKYALIDYSMFLKMTLHAAPGDSFRIKEFEGSIPLFRQKYGDKNVRYDEVGRTIRSLVRTSLIAIKDNISKDWTFLNFEEDDSIPEDLLSSDIITRLKSFKD